MNVMIFPVLLVVFCYVLHRMCTEKGVSPWSYLTGFITGFLLIIMATWSIINFLFGRNAINDPEMQKTILALWPFAMLFHFLLFVFFRRKISRIPDYPDDKDDSHTPPPSSGKKDLSYFR